MTTLGQRLRYSTGRLRGLKTKKKRKEKALHSVLNYRGRQLQLCQSLSELSRIKAYTALSDSADDNINRKMLGNTAEKNLSSLIFVRCLYVNWLLKSCFCQLLRS